MWEQLTLAAENGIDRLWILNVGDLKPMEYPIQLFIDMAWNPTAYTTENLLDHTSRFCAAAFGEEQAAEAARILNLQCKYAGRCTAEMLDAKTYSLKDGEWEKAVSDYAALERDALRQYTALPESCRDAYQELILFPVQAMANLYDMYYAQAMNHQLYEQGNPDANSWAERCRHDFRRDSLLCAAYNHNIAGGKWNGMMIQKHIGYTTWNDNFPHDMLPKLYQVKPRTDSWIIDAKGDKVVLEAEHYFSKRDGEGARWIDIPFMGPSLGAMTLRPTTASVNGAQLEYRFRGLNATDSVTITVTTKCTLDFLNQGGLHYRVSLDGKGETVNFNANLNEKPENIYSIYYPTVARRIVEKQVTLPLQQLSDGIHRLVFEPLDPGVVLEKITIKTK